MALVTISPLVQIMVCSSKFIGRIQPGDDQHSSLTLTIKQVDQQLSEKKLEQYARLLNKYLQQVGQGLEFYLRTGERCFQESIWFSPVFLPDPSIIHPLLNLLIPQRRFLSGNHLV